MGYLPNKLSQITTPLKVKQWERDLKDFPDTCKDSSGYQRNERRIPNKISVPLLNMPELLEKHVVSTRQHQGGGRVLGGASRDV